jgi:DNA-binding CsgD family transcriptional regulator
VTARIGTSRSWLGGNASSALGVVLAAEGSLTEAERELAVLKLLATNLSTREIAARVVLSEHTIRSHTRTLYRKLGAHTRAEAVIRATALGLLGKRDHRDETPSFAPPHVDDGMLRHVAGRNYRLPVKLRA